MSSLTPEREAEIREHAVEYRRKGIGSAVLDLLAEIDRLRDELTKASDRETQQAYVRDRLEQAIRDALDHLARIEHQAPNNPKGAVVEQVGIVWKYLREAVEEKPAPDIAKDLRVGAQGLAHIPYTLSHNPHAVEVERVLKILRRAAKRR